MKKFLTAALLIFSLNSAWALDLEEAKERGLVGEANDGYLAAVQQPASPEVKALVDDVNAKRRTRFQQTADNNNIRPEQVSHRFYQLAVQKTAPGHYYQDANGSWQKK